jgi:hypothetical protein
MLADHAWISFLLNQPEQVNRTLGQLPDRSAIALFTTRLEEWLSVDGVDKRFRTQALSLEPQIQMTMLPVIGESSNRSMAFAEVIESLSETTAAAPVCRTARKIAEKWGLTVANVPHPDWYLTKVNGVEICFLRVRIPKEDPNVPPDELLVLETEVTWGLVKALKPEIYDRHENPPVNMPAGGLTASEMLEICDLLSDYHELERAYTQPDRGVVQLASETSGFRLPTTVEFFYIASGEREWKAIIQTYQYLGQYMEDKDRHEQLTKYANAQGVSPSGDGKNRALPVGSLRPNVLGLYDTLGNLAEVNWPAEENILQNYDGLCFQGGDYDCERDSLNLSPPETNTFHFKIPVKGDSTTGFRIVRKDSR